ncbi:MAG: CBS domain-containing protein [Polyangiaceae bacterium]
MTLRRFRHEVVTCTVEEPVEDIAKKLATSHVGCVVLVREGRPIGVLTDRDLVIRVVAAGKSAKTTRASDVVTYDPFVIEENAGVAGALRAMRSHGVRRLPIVDDEGMLVGIVTTDDLMTLYGQRLFELAQCIEANADATDTR